MLVAPVAWGISFLCTGQQQCVLTRVAGPGELCQLPWQSLQQWGQRGAGLPLLLAMSWVKHSHLTCHFLVVSPGVRAEINSLLPGGRCGHYRTKQRGDTGSFCHLGPRCHFAGSVMISSHLFLSVLRPVSASVCVPFPFLFFTSLLLGRAGAAVVPWCPSSSPSPAPVASVQDAVTG